MSQQSPSPSLSVVSSGTKTAMPTALGLASGASDRYSVVIAQSMSDCAASWRLFEEDASPAVFQTHDWLSCWMDTVGAAQRASPRIALVGDSNARLVMILPLMLVSRWGMQVLCWMAEDDADYHAPLVAPDFAATCNSSTMRDILARIVRQVPEASAISLVKTTSMFMDQPSPLSKLPHHPHPCAAHAVHLPGGSFDDFYAAARSKSTRKRDRQRRRKLEDYGDVRFEIATDTSRQHDLLNVILAQKADWLSARGIKDPFAEDGVHTFLHRLIENRTTRQHLHISALTVDDAVAAGNVGYVYEGRFYAVIGSVTNGELARHSPGVLHLHDLFRWCYDHDVSVFDLTVGDEGYKNEWCDSRLDLIDIRMPLSVSGVFFIAAQRLWALAKRRIKASPALFSIATRIRSRTRSLVSR